MRTRGRRRYQRLIDDLSRRFLPAGVRVRGQGSGDETRTGDTGNSRPPSDTVFHREWLENQQKGGDPPSSDWND